jgi:hypothetical protein
MKTIAVDGQSDIATLVEPQARQYGEKTGFL